MIKLKDLLKLDEMVFSDTVKERHSKKMKRKLVYIHEPVIAHNPPPQNSSRETREELDYLLKYNNGKIDNEYVKQGDNVKSSFKKYCEENNLKYPKEYVKELIKDSGRIIYELKYKYNRPRPFQLGEFYKIPDFKIHNLNTANTPSYPSGHSTQGIFIARALGKKYPHHEKGLMEVGKMISNSRTMARAHFPSDTIFGEELGEILFKNLTNISEGSPTSNIKGLKGATGFIKPSEWKSKKKSLKKSITNSTGYIMSDIDDKVKDSGDEYRSYTRPEMIKLKPLLERVDYQDTASQLVKQYGLKSKIKMGRGKNFGEYIPETDTITLRPSYPNMKEFLMTILHEIGHALDAKRIGVRKYIKKYTQAGTMAAYDGLDPHDDNKWEEKAEKFAEKELKKWL